MISLKLKQKSVFLYLTLPGLFVADILYGLAQFYKIELLLSPGILLRGALLFSAFFIVLWRCRRLPGTEAMWLSLLIFLAVPGLLIGLLSTKSFSYDLISLSKVLYLPVICAFFIICFNRMKISSSDVLRALEFSAYFLGISLFLSQVLGVQSFTYGDYAFGNTGVFYAQNDLTLAFGLSLIAAAYRLVFVDFSLTRSFFLVSSLVGCLQIGTNASLAIPIIILCVLFSVYVVGGVRGSWKSYLSKLFIFALVSCVFIYLFFQFLEIHISHDYQSKKIESLLQGESGRAPLTLAAKQYISHRSYLSDMFGEGFDSFHRGVASYFFGLSDRRIVESDPYDIFGAHGFLFLCAIYLYLLKSFILAIKRSFTSKNADVHILIASAIFLYTFYSVLVGHALTSPIPSTLLAAYLASSYVAQKKQGWC